MERRQFTEEFKREAVKLARQPGASKAGIAKDLGINTNMLARWAREQQGNTSKANGGNRAVVPNDEFERMRRELAKLRTERDILKNRPTRPPVALMNRNSRRVHWMHAETVTERFLEA